MEDYDDFDDAGLQAMAEGAVAQSEIALVSLRHRRLRRV
jgi:hypothetical protein